MTKSWSLQAETKKWIHYIERKIVGPDKSFFLKWPEKQSRQKNIIFVSPSKYLLSKRGSSKNATTFTCQNWKTNSLMWSGGRLRLKKQQVYFPPKENLSPWSTQQLSFFNNVTKWSSAETTSTFQNSLSSSKLCSGGCLGTP